MHLAACPSCKSMYERLRDAEPTLRRRRVSQRFWVAVAAIAAVVYLLFQQPHFLQRSGLARWLGPHRGIQVSPLP